MEQDLSDWNSFWDLATPEEAARLLIDFYGADAMAAAINCAQGARADERDDDYSFWIAAYARLRSGMADATVDADSFGNRGTLRDGARAIAEIYGADAAVQAARLARDACAAGHEENHRFWTAIHARLVAAGFRRGEGPEP